MNLAFVGYEELSRSRRVLSNSAFGLDLLNSSYPTKPHLLMTKYTMSFWTRRRKQPSMPATAPSRPRARRFLVTWS